MQRFFSDHRFRRDRESGYDDVSRSEFDRDYDRLIFSSAFRRLQDKTQVFPLSRNDFTRTRLTHSIEVACVGRSLGRHADLIFHERGLLPHESSPSGPIVAAACIAHDIGNPPFGHSGESAIQAWARRNIFAETFENEHQRQDLYNFEGNAQGLRVVTRLQCNRRPGGLQLTLATLGAMMKYPCGSLLGSAKRDPSRAEQKKFGYFLDDRDDVVKALDALGMKRYAEGAYRRHPLAYLVEAADDICYAVIDLEDSVDQKLVNADEASSSLIPLAQCVPKFVDSQSYRDKSRLHWLRAYAIQGLIYRCVKAFQEHLEPICEGEFPKSLLEVSGVFDEYLAVKQLVKSTAYVDDRVLAVELAGYKVIGGLLDILVPAMMDPALPYHRKLLETFPVSYLSHEGDRRPKVEILAAMTNYQRTLVATDYVAGMTDGFAVDLYQTLSGIKLPH